MKTKEFSIIRQSIICVYLLLQSFLLLGQSNSLFDLVFSIDDAHLYVPDNGDPLALWKKSDLKISYDRHFNRNTDYYQYSSPKMINNFKIGFSPSSKFYATASFFQYEDNVFMSSSFNEKMTLGDVGIGTYFSKIDTLSSGIFLFKKKRKWMMERGILMNGLVGFSKGRMSHQRNYKIGQSKFNFNRIYGQLGLHLQRSLWGISANTKFGMLNYYKSSLVGHAASDLAPLSDLLKRQNNFFFFESSFRIYLGTRFGQLYFNLVHAESNASFREYIVADYKSVGVVLDVEGFFRKTLRN